MTLDNENLTPDVFLALQRVAVHAWDAHLIDWAEYETLAESLERLEELL